MTGMPRITTSTAFATAAFLALFLDPAAGQSAQEVVQTAMERYEQRMEGIDNYTIVHAMSGSESTVYFERVESESGHPAYRPVTLGEFMESASEGEMGDAMAEGGSDAALGAADPYAMFEQIAPRADLRGTEDVDGRQAYVIAVDDMSGVDFGGMTGAGDAARSFRPSSMTMWIDADRYVALRSSITGTLEMDGRESEVTLDARMSDYREVEGMLHPFRTEVAMEGFGGAMSEEQREQLRQAREQMERQMEGMSEQQRAMVESMMEERMPDMEAMSGGAMTLELEVRELRVNEGPPEGMEAAAERQAQMDEARERRAAEREEERREEERQRRPREPELVDPADHEMRYPQYQGLYESTGEESTTWFVTERCGSGDLVIGSMRGDVAPWVFDEVAEGEFRAPPISPGGSGMHVRFETGPGGDPVFRALGERWADFGTFRLSGELPERWEKCMQPRM